MKGHQSRFWDKKLQISLKYSQRLFTRKEKYTENSIE